LVLRKTHYEFRAEPNKLVNHYKQLFINQKTKFFSTKLSFFQPKVINNKNTPLVWTSIFAKPKTNKHMCKQILIQSARNASLPTFDA
jgi:hypothetical protein